MKEQDQEPNAWEDTDDLGDRIAEPVFGPVFALGVIVAVFLLGLVAMALLCGRQSVDVFINFVSEFARQFIP